MSRLVSRTGAAALVGGGWRALVRRGPARRIATHPCRTSRRPSLMPRTNTIEHHPLPSRSRRRRVLPLPLSHPSPTLSRASRVHGMHLGDTGGIIIGAASLPSSVPPVPIPVPGTMEPYRAIRVPPLAVTRAAAASPGSRLPRAPHTQRPPLPRWGGSTVAVVWPGRRGGVAAIA